MPQFLLNGCRGALAIAQPPVGQTDAHATGFDNITAVDGQTVRLTHDITDLIFMEG
jgi:hypothetical protein